MLQAALSCCDALPPANLASGIVQNQKMNDCNVDDLDPHPKVDHWHNRHESETTGRPIDRQPGFRAHGNSNTIGGGHAWQDPARIPKRGESMAPLKVIRRKASADAEQVAGNLKEPPDNSYNKRNLTDAEVLRYSGKSFTTDKGRHKYLKNYRKDEEREKRKLAQEEGLFSTFSDTKTEIAAIREKHKEAGKERLKARKAQLIALGQKQKRDKLRALAELTEL